MRNHKPHDEDRSNQAVSEIKTWIEEMWMAGSQLDEIEDALEDALSNALRKPCSVDVLVVL